MKPISVLLPVLAAVCLSAIPAFGDSIERRVRNAAEVVINRQTGIRPVPKFVVDASKCIAALKVVKVGFIWGGEGSTGLVSCRTDNDQWSAPSFFNTGGVNFGLQIGIQFLESVLLFMTDKAREILEHGTFEIGADLSFAAGPVGGGGGAGVIPEAAILTYDRAVGLYAGATVEGFVLTHDRSTNKKVYSKELSPSAILAMDSAGAPKVVSPFVETMNKFLPIE